MGSLWRFKESKSKRYSAIAVPTYKGRISGAIPKDVRAMLFTKSGRKIIIRKKR